jgi:ABC-2 type transport system permease protein
MLKKIWYIAWRDLYITFTDRNLLLIMIAAPLALSTIIGLAFSGLSGSGSDVSIKDIPVAVVNLDKGANGQNLGQIFVSSLVPGADSGTGSGQPACAALAQSQDANKKNPLFTLTKSVRLDDPAVARAGVDNGTYTAAIIIPEDFTAKTTFSVTNTTIQPSAVEVYANSGRSLTAGIIRSVAEGITNQIATGNIAVAATLNTVGQRYGLLQIGAVASSDSFTQNIGCAYMPDFSNIKIDQRTVAGDQTRQPNFLVLIGSAQAMFFMLFTAQGSVSSIMEERRSWTLQRLIITPTPRLVILLGKLLGTFVNCLFQLLLLSIALTLVGSAMQGSFTFIWGTNLFGFAVVAIAASLAASGIGTLLLAVSRTPEQGQIYGSVLNVAMAALGGAFGFSLPPAIAGFSPIYWGTNAFGKLSAGQNDILLNVLILIIEGGVLFFVGLWLFNRRADI